MTLRSHEEIIEILLSSTSLRKHTKRVVTRDNKPFCLLRCPVNWFTFRITFSYSWILPGNNDSLNFIQKKPRRDNERKLSSRDLDTISESNSRNTMNSRTSDYASSDASSGRFSSALSRLKYSDYKPLMRTFTRRFDSPPKVNISRNILINKLSRTFAKILFL